MTDTTESRDPAPRERRVCPKCVWMRDISWLPIMVSDRQCVHPDVVKGDAAYLAGDRTGVPVIEERSRETGQCGPNGNLFRRIPRD